MLNQFTERNLRRPTRQHPASNPMFGSFIKELRLRRQLSLRAFCLKHGHAPANWSRLERELIPPPHDQPTLRAWARQLRLKPASEDWHKFFDYAAIAAAASPPAFSPTRPSPPSAPPSSSPSPARNRIPKKRTNSLPSAKVRAVLEGPAQILETRIPRISTEDTNMGGVPPSPEIPYRRLGRAPPSSATPDSGTRLTMQRASYIRTCVTGPFTGCSTDSASSSKAGLLSGQNNHPPVGKQGSLPNLFA
jgi:hypothetical protein